MQLSWGHTINRVGKVRGSGSRDLGGSASLWGGKERRWMGRAGN